MGVASLIYSAGQGLVKCPLLALKFGALRVNTQLAAGKYFLCTHLPKAAAGHTAFHHDVTCAVYMGTLQPLYYMVRYNTVLDITRFKDGSQKCINYIEK